MIDEPAAQDPAPTAPCRVTDPDGHIVEVFALPTDQPRLEGLLRELFEKHWRVITFGPLIQGAAWEMRAPHAPTYVGTLDGYLTVAFGASHFHLCIGPTQNRIRIQIRGGNLSNALGG